MSLLALRVQGGIEDEPWQDIPLSGGLSIDSVAASLIAQADHDEDVGAAFGLGPDTEADDLEEIVECIKGMLGDTGASPDLN